MDSVWTCCWVRVAAAENPSMASNQLRFSSGAEILRTWISKKPLSFSHPSTYSHYSLTQIPALPRCASVRARSPLSDLQRAPFMIIVADADAAALHTYIMIWRCITFILLWQRCLTHIQTNSKTPHLYILYIRSLERDFFSSFARNHSGCDVYYMKINCFGGLYEFIGPASYMIRMMNEI